MKMRQKLIAVLAASMVVTSVPVVTMADTTNYVSAARYAKKGTTYGYSVVDNKVVGTSGLSQYTDFNGFEFAPIMNYTQPGTMFMSLTKDTTFNAQAILTYVDLADTTNYVSAARYAKKGTTYGYSVVDNKVVGTSGLSQYTDFNGFEFAPIMNYTQPGTMFMSLTKDTTFNAQAILTYVDSFNASNDRVVAKTDLKVLDGKVYDHNKKKYSCS